MPAVAALADEAATTPLDDIGGYTILADHASILHENLETRIYRT
jgi:urease accessory protein UreF